MVVQDATHILKWALTALRWYGKGNGNSLVSDPPSALSALPRSSKGMHFACLHSEVSAFVPILTPVQKAIISWHLSPTGIAGLTSRLG